MQEAVAELQRRAALPWNQPPNRAPCKFWWTCCRRYQLVEFDDSRHPWKELQRIAVLEVSAAGVTWFR